MLMQLEAPNQTRVHRVRPATHVLVSALRQAGIAIQHIDWDIEGGGHDSIVLKDGDVITLDYRRSTPYVDLLLRAGHAPDQRHFVDRIRQNPESDIATAMNRLARLRSWSGRSRLR